MPSMSDSKAPAPDNKADKKNPAPAADEPSTTAAPPPPPSTTAAIYIEDHQFVVEVEGVDDEEPDRSGAADIDPRDTKALQDLISAETGRKAALRRPFYHVDTESLLVLQNAIRAEMAGR